MRYETKLSRRDEIAASRHWPNTFKNMTREAANGAAGAQAAERAVAAGADRTSLQTIEIEDIPLAYLPGNAIRVHVRVAGERRSPG
jgi:N-methylhydantoinase A/oxoprolinase/acetone carboxylase beta subunit